MKADIVFAETTEPCEPLTCSRPLGHCFLAGAPLADLQEQQLLQAGIQQVGRIEAGTDEKKSSSSELRLYLPTQSWLAIADIQRLMQQDKPTQLVDDNSTPLAWTGYSPHETPEQTSVKESETSMFICYPWDLLALNEQLVADMSEDNWETEIGAQVEIDGFLSVGENTEFLPGVYIEGNVVIGRNCKIGPNCYIRGKTAIADNCRVGQAVEVKNSILMDGATAGHLSYIGDSIIGENANLGAGTIVANLRHDNGSHRSAVQGILQDTGRRKFGTVIGDGVHTGIHTSIYPGRKIWPGVGTKPAEVVAKDLHPG